jgi:methyl-accepting chemotaxis protein
MRDLSQVTPESTLGDLPLSDFQVSPTTLGRAIAHQFSQRSDLPGVIIADRQGIVGTISRRNFYAIVNRPQHRDAFINRPVSVFLKNHKKSLRFLQMRDSEKIDVAVRLALSRPNQDVYEPIVVLFTDPGLPDFKAFFLLDFKTLLIAQTKIITAVNLEIHASRTETQHYIQKLEREQHKVQEYAKLLESQKTVIQERNLLLETQQVELLEQAREISHYNKRLIKIGKLLSSEGKKAFQATFDGVNAICQNTAQIVNTGRLLSSELQTIRETSKLIEEISRQVQHLAVQAAIVANRTGFEMRGFGQITSEIGKLVGQTFEAAGRTEQVAERFRNHIADLTQSAHAGTTTARSLVSKIEQAEIALAELEALVQLEKAATLHPPEDDKTTLIERPESSEELVQKIAQAETTLSELKELVQYKESSSLIEKIRRVLTQAQNATAERSQSRSKLK